MTYSFGVEESQRRPAVSRGLRDVAQVAALTWQGSRCRHAVGAYLVRGHPFFSRSLADYLGQSLTKQALG